MGIGGCICGELRASRVSGPSTPTLPSQQGGKFSLPLAQPLASKHLASIKAAGRAPDVPMPRPGRHVYRCSAALIDFRSRGQILTPVAGGDRKELMII